jgi:glycosyltransferase involved in cell wall biosynthesis
MNKKTKVLFIYQDVIFYRWIPPFIKKDIELLKKHFEVKTFCFNFFPFNLKKILYLPFEIRNSDIVFIWFAGDHAFISTLINLIIKKPMVVVTGGYDTAKVKEMKYGNMIHPLLKIMVKFTLKHASKILAVSNFNKSEIEKNLGINNADVTYLTVDTNYFSTGTNKEDMVIAVSAANNWNRVKLKGLDVYVRAARLLPKEKFLLIGAYNEALKNLKDIAPSNVEFIPLISQDELIKYYHKAKVFCQLSYYESFGLAVAEAMSCQCTPVTTRQGALPEIVGNAGFLVNYGREDEAAEAIKQALNDNKKGIDARKKVLENFSLERREKQLFEVIQSILKEN